MNHIKSAEQFMEVVRTADLADLKSQREIFSYWDKRVDKSRAAAVDMLCYAVKGILCPTFIVNQTGDLLDLLAQLETIRRHTVTTCHHVLRLNRSYKNDTHARIVDGFALLPEDEERALESVSSWTRQQEARKTYVSLVTWSCLNYIHDLLARGKLGDAEKRLPDWYGDDPRQSLPHRPFYANWDEEERRVVADRKEDVTLLISDARAWEKKHGHTEHMQYVKHLRRDLGVDVSHFHTNVGAMTNGYLKGVMDIDSQLHAILNLKLGASGFG
ncbi:hypothetical protein BDM02DRAFT_3111266 [Thelephora ganbajun]|uniref:Uncharacterized protein n=1 Tax=Thelephora ganbajun TaxID=370292 RepID=A0ACB6ZNQ3_THEGA|nr:hypothetical protein BDM02DRAFT_3111266 [Thelephora ganbajun]